MTATVERTAVDDAISTIDAALPTMQDRELVSTDEVTDLLLDLRHHLTTDG